MFTQTRIKLTTWYLVIIMTISLLFSAASYRNFLLEFQRGLRAQAFHFYPNTTYIEPDDLLPLPFITTPRIYSTYENQIFIEARDRILTSLGLINLGIFITAGISGYFLAGRTLKPIETMLEEQKRFVSDASHELRTPLTAMTTETEVALRDKNLDLASAKDMLRSNLEEAGKMQSLANYLLKLGKYQNNQQKIQKQKVAISELANNAIKKLAPLAKTKNVMLETKLEKVNAYVNSDSVSELFSILIDNAIKYSKENGKIIIKVSKTAGRASFSVSDFGMGIAKKDLPFIFDRFYRADISRDKNQTDGYGLGLSIAKSIVDMHGGNISVSSKIGRGSTFKVIF
jgi:two-component system, OmpR family, sensor histidine kinase CiaH